MWEPVGRLETFAMGTVIALIAVALIRGARGAQQTGHALMFWWPRVEAYRADEPATFWFIVALMMLFGCMAALVSLVFLVSAVTGAFPIYARHGA